MDPGRPSCECLDWQKREPAGGCKHILHVKIKKGMIDPLPSPKTTPSTSRFGSQNRYSPNWPSLSRRTRTRDNWTCQKCGVKGGSYGTARLEAHHIIPKSKGGKDRPENLITLCHTCHQNTHGHAIPTRSSSRSPSSPSQKHNRSNSRPSKSLVDTPTVGGISFTSKSGDTLFSNIDPDPLVLQAIPDEITVEDYESQISRTGGLHLSVLSFFVSLPLFSIFFDGFGVWAVAILASTFIYALSNHTPVDIQKKVEEIESHIDELRSYIEEVNAKVDDDKAVRYEESQRIRTRLTKLDSCLDDSAMRNLNQDFLDWVDESKKKSGL